MLTSQKKAGLTTAISETWEIYRRLISAQFKGSMLYRASFLLDCLGYGLWTATDFIMIAVLLSRFPTLAGWNFNEVAVLYGIAASSFTLAQLFARGLENFDKYIQLGELDRILVRPVSPLVQILAIELPLRRLGRLAQSGGVLVVACLSLQISWDWAKVLLLALTLLTGVIIFIAIHIIGAVTTIWTISTVEFANIFTNGGAYLSSFPLSIYQEWFRNFFLFIVPLGFIAYLPVSYILDKPDSAGLPNWTGWLGLPIAILFLLISLGVWRLGLRKYQSTGT